MERKLIQLSSSTLVVSLPKNWLNKEGLGKGNKILVEELKEGLLLTSKASQIAKKEIVIDVKDYLLKQIWLLFDCAYSSGYSKITLNNVGSKSVKLMKIMRFFPGLLITEQGSNVLVFEVMKNENLDIDKLINRLFSLSVVLIKEGIAGSKNLKKMDYTINSYVSYIIRYLKDDKMLPLIYNIESFVDNLIELFDFEIDVSLLLENFILLKKCFNLDDKDEMVKIHRQILSCSFDSSLEGLHLKFLNDKLKECVEFLIKANKL